MAVEDPPGVLNVDSTDSAVLRHAMQAILGGAVGAFAGGIGATNGAAHGVCTAGSLAVTQNGTPNMSVNVAAGTALITGTASALQGPYSFYNDATVNLVVAAADATNPRKDLVIAQVRDATYDGTGVRDARLTVVTGTPAASPVDPSLAAHPNALVLARIDVPALDTAIGTAQITDLRTRAGREELRRFPWQFYTPALGGSGWSLGTGGGSFGRYLEIGEIVFIHARLIFGTSGATFGAAMPTVSLPSTPQEGAAGLPLWNTMRCEYMDASPSNSYEGKAFLSGATVGLGVTLVNATYPVITLVSNTVPITWAASDEIRVSGWYMKAA
jgi:hypothetical protein